MAEKFLLPKGEIEKILEEGKKSFLKEIESSKFEKIENLCRKNFLQPDLHNFLKLFPENYVKILKRVFENPSPKSNIKTFLIKTLREENFQEDFREKTKDLEEYFVLDFIRKNIENIFLVFENYYMGKEEEIKLSPVFEKIKGLYGEKGLRNLMEKILDKINYEINVKEIEEIFKRFERNLEENFLKVKEKIEIPPLLILQMGLNSLNIRYPHLFRNLSPEGEKELKKKFLALKERGLKICILYSLAKFFRDENLNFNDINEKNLNYIEEKFLMGMDLKLSINVKDINLLKKGFIFKKILFEKDFKILKEAEELLEQDETFYEIFKEKVYREYEEFVKREIFNLLRKDKNSVSILRNLLYSPSFFSHIEILPFYKLKEYFVDFFEREELLGPFEEYERNVFSKIMERISKLKQNFSKIDKDTFKKEALEIFEEISGSIILWEDFGRLLEEFSREFMHLPQIPEEVIENFSRLSYNYLSILLDEANFIDFPMDAKPQISLFETIRGAKEKGKVLSLAEYLKNPISYNEWEELLYSLKLSTSYRDFYKYIKGFITSKEALLLLKNTIETLQEEDIDLSLSQRIFQDLSFMPEINEEEFFNLILDPNNFYIHKNELKEKIFGIYPILQENLKNLIKRKGFYTEALEIEFTRKEESFLNFLKELNLSHSYISFSDYLKFSKASFKREENISWEEFFIPIKHYLIQIEPSKDGFFITLNLSGRREGPHPFEGQRIKVKRVSNPKEISWVIFLFQKYVSFLLDLEEDLFEFEYKEPKKFQKYKMKTKKQDKVISFKRKDGKFLLKLKIEKNNLKKIWAKAFGPFYASEKDETMAEEDARFLLSALKNVLI